MIFVALKNKHMKTVSLFGILCLLITACSTKTTENTMVVTGNVKGLKKGTIYLQKIEDTTLVSVDSLLIKGDGSFSLRTELESPEIYYLYLDKVDNSEFNDRITFFAEAGTITINTSWNTFATNAKIEGSKSHKKYEEFQKNMSKFNTASLEFGNKLAMPEYSENKELFDSISELANKNNVRAYLYALNYSLNNKDSYISPYLALTEVPNANVKYLDSIYNSLADSVASSKYGIQLKEHIATMKLAK